MIYDRFSVTRSDYALQGGGYLTVANIEEALSRLQEEVPRPPPLPKLVEELAKAWDQANERERLAFGTSMYRTCVVLADMVYHELDTACAARGLDTKAVIQNIRSTY